MMKRLPRLGALAPRLHYPRTLHTTPAARKDDKPQSYKATIVEDDEPAATKPKDSSTSSQTPPKTHPFFDQEHEYTDERTGSAKRPTVLSRLEHAAEDIHSAEQRGKRLAAEAELLDAETQAAKKPIPLPPRRTWAESVQKLTEAQEDGEDVLNKDYKPAEDYTALPSVGGLKGWFDSKERWTRRVRPSTRDFFPPSVDAKRARQKSWSEVVAIAVVEALEARGLTDRSKAVEKAIEEGQWMQGVKLDDLLLKFDICKRVFGMAGFKVPDAKLPALTTVHDLYLLVAGPAPPKTVYQAVRALTKPGHRSTIRATNTAAKDTAIIRRPRVITQTPALMRLPNVRVLARPLTDVQREREVGRWKVVQREWRERGLPTGANLSKVDKGPEKKWAFGKP